MGTFKYICTICGEPLNLNNKAVLIHIREGEVLGQVEGCYNEYGGVFGSDFNENVEGINGQDEIYNSEEESFPREKRLIDIDEETHCVKLCDYLRYCQTNFTYCMTNNLPFEETEIYKVLAKSNKVNSENAKRLTHVYSEKNSNVDIFLFINKTLVIHYFEEVLPLPEGQSGVLAFHSGCYKKFLKRKDNDITKLDVSSYI